MRYIGQSYEIETSVLAEWLGAGQIEPLAKAFHAAHQRIFNHADPEATPEMVNLRVRAVGQAATWVEQAPALPSTAAAPTGQRRIHIRGAWEDARLYDRAALGGGQQLAGPAIVEQADTTTVIPSGWVAAVDRFGNLVIERSGNV
jgi:N-methylhydantoinase A